MANTLTLTSATFDTTGQRFGTAALNGGYGQAPAGLLTGLPFAWEIRFKAVSAPGALQVIMGQSGLGFAAMQSSGKVLFEIGSGSGTPVDITSSASAADGNWHTLAISVASSGGTALLDGAVVGNWTAAQVSSAGMNYAVTSGTGTLGVRVHGASGGSYVFAAGEVDEAAVWSTNRFTAAYTPATTAYTGSESGLLALWHLDGNGVDSAGTPSISAPAVSGTTVGGSTTVSGTFANGAPIGLSQTLDGSTAAVSGATIVTASGSGATAAGTYSFTIGTPGAGNHTISVAGTGTYAATSGSTAFTTSAASVTVLPGSPAILYSPYNWSAGKTINPGATFRMLFTGSSVSMTFDVSQQSTPLPQLWVSIDGQPWQQFTLSATVTPAMPGTTAGWPQHHLEVIVKSTSEFVSRWTPQNAAVVLTGIVLAAGSTVSAPVTLMRNVLMFGDSITEGYHTVASGDTDGSDAMLGWAFMQRALLGAEVGVVGFGGAGLTVTGQGGVPVLSTSCTSLWNGQARAFSPAPALIVINYGENDGAASAGAFQSAYQAVLALLLSATPSTTLVAAMRPFSGKQAAAIQAAIAAVGSPRVRYVDTTGLFNTALSVDGQHPLGVANAGTIGRGVAGLLAPMLAGVVNRWTHA